MEGNWGYDDLMIDDESCLPPKTFSLYCIYDILEIGQ